MNHLFTIISANDQNQNDTKASNKYQTPLNLNRSVNDSFGSCCSSAVSQTPVSVIPRIKVEDSETLMSPTRYRSLDTLTAICGDGEIPEPGELRKESPTKDSTSVFQHSTPVSIYFFS